MRKHGFTLLETLVVISIFGLIFPLVLSILFVILQQQLRINSLTEVKRQGDYITDYLQNAIANNAYKIYDLNSNEICDSNPINPFPHSGTPESFHDQFGSQFSINWSPPDLFINYAAPSVPAPTFAFPQGQLNNTKVIIDSFQISCSRPSIFAAPLISVSFTICFKHGASCASSEPQKVVSLDYQTFIKLRSFPTE